MTSLVMQSFGRESELKRAILTVLSFYACTSEPIDNTEVILFTDNPSYFASYFHNLPVRYRLLTPKKVEQMRGEINFLHRMKIAMIEEAFTLTNNNLLYADSDTFFISDPAPLLEQLREDVSFMHVHEYDFESVRNMELPAGKTFRAFLELIESQNFLLPGGKEITITSKHSSWNAGVMFFHASQAKLIPAVYALTDQFYPKTQNHASEQYAFSVMLQETTQLQPCDSVIYHYWYRVKKQIIDQFLLLRLNQLWAKQGMRKKLSLINEWTEYLPKYFESHVMTLKDNSIQLLNQNDFKNGYNYALKAFMNGAVKDTVFIKDVLYHAKRQLLKK